MALIKITDQHGFDATAAAEIKHHPENEAAWLKRRNSLRQMRETVNSLVDEVNAIKANPHGGSSFLQPPASS